MARLSLSVVAQTGPRDCGSIRANQDGCVLPQPPLPNPDTPPEQPTLQGRPVLDEEGAKELVEFCNCYDYALMRARRSEKMRKTANPVSTSVGRGNESADTLDF